jgi:hypothetical protein
METQITVDLDEVVAWLEVAQQAPEMTDREATTAMRLAVGAVERQVVPRTPVNIGALKAAWSNRIMKGQRAIKGEILNPKEYAIVIEKGRRAGAKMPPLGPIAYWLYRKGLVTDRSEIRQAAYLVARAIGRHGFSRKGQVGPKGKRMLEEGFSAAEPTVYRIFEKVPDTVFNRLK